MIQIGFFFVRFALRFVCTRTRAIYLHFFCNVWIKKTRSNPGKKAVHVAENAIRWVGVVAIISRPDTKWLNDGNSFCLIIFSYHQYVRFAFYVFDVYVVWWLVESIGSVCGRTILWCLCRIMSHNDCKSRLTMYALCNEYAKRKKITGDQNVDWRRNGDGGHVNAILRLFAHTIAEQRIFFSRCIFLLSKRFFFFSISHHWRVCVVVVVVDFLRCHYCRCCLLPDKIAIEWYSEFTFFSLRRSWMVWCGLARARLSWKPQKKLKRSACTFR